MNYINIAYTEYGIPRYNNLLFLEDGSEPCDDKALASSCKWWKGQNYCKGHMYSPWLKINCPKTCGYC